MNPTNHTQGLHNPSLTLYAFHLRSRIGQEKEEIVPNASGLWEQLTELGETLQIPELKALPQALICYQGGIYNPTVEDKYWAKAKKLTLLHSDAQEIDFHPIHQANELDLQGFICPFRIHDTYAIDLTLKSEATIAPTQVSLLNPQNCLLPPYIQASLGQTLLFYAEPTGHQDDYRSLANSCIQALRLNTDPLHLVAQGRLLSSLIFEYDNGEIAPVDRRHVLVWFNCDDSLPDEIDQVLEPLFYLLWCQHKILYAYDQAHWCVQQARQFYATIEQRVRNFPQLAAQANRLEQFKALLVQLPPKALEYALYLRDLEDHQTTIATNIQNYIHQLEKLASLPNSDLNFLRQFLEQSQNKLQRQIQVERSYLTVGYNLYNRLLESIQSIIAIDQVESDRQFYFSLQERERQFYLALQESDRQFQLSLQESTRQFQLELQKQEVARQESIRQQEEEDQKRELRLQIAIAFFGFGFAVSGISSQVNPTPLENILGKSPPEGTPWTNTVITLNMLDVVIHIVIGLLAGLIAALIVSCRQQQSIRSSSQSDGDESTQS